MQTATEESKEEEEEITEGNETATDNAQLASAAGVNPGNSRSRKTIEDEETEADEESTGQVAPSKHSKYKSLALIYFGVLLLLLAAVFFLRKGNKINEYKL